MPSHSDAHDALLQFLYLAPSGLVQADAFGRIKVINPVAIKMLLPLVPQGEISNLFDCLSDVAPDLARLSASFSAPNGVVCEALELRTPAPVASTAPASQKTLELTLLKLDEHNLMACLSPAASWAGNQMRTSHPPACVNTHTELPDHSMIHRRLEDLLGSKADLTDETDTPLAVLAVHCDQLGHLNDAHGHHQSGALINAVASRLCNQIHRRFAADLSASTAPVVGTLGHDQFVVLFAQAPSFELLQTHTNELARSLSEPYQVGVTALRTTASAGLVFYPPTLPVKNAEAVLQEASVAMHRARQAQPAPGVFCQCVNAPRDTTDDEDSIARNNSPSLPRSLMDRTPQAAA